MIHLKWVRIIYKLFHNKVVMGLALFSPPFSYYIDLMSNFLSLTGLECMLLEKNDSLGETGENTGTCLHLWVYKEKGLCVKIKCRSQKDDRL